MTFFFIKRLCQRDTHTNFAYNCSRHIEYSLSVYCAQKSQQDAQECQYSSKSERIQEGLERKAETGEFELFRHKK